MLDGATNDEVLFHRKALTEAQKRYASYSGHYNKLIETGETSEFLLREARQAKEDANHHIGVVQRSLSAAIRTASRV